MLYVFDDGTIQLTRGDTARLSTVISNGATGQPYEIRPNDVLTLTVKKTVKDLEPRFQKTITGTNVFHILPAGYHNGTGTVSIDVETKTTTPTEEKQDIVPTSGKVLTKVTVDAIPAKFGDVTTATGIAADVLAGKIVFGKSASGAAVKITGTMANNGSTGGTIDGLTTTSYTIPSGYTSGGTVTLSNAIETALAAI